LRADAVYAALQVPEVWTYDGKTARAHRLGPAGRYASVPESLTFPGIPLIEVSGFLGRRKNTDETNLVRDFRGRARFMVGTHPVCGEGAGSYRGRPENQAEVETPFRGRPVRRRLFRSVACLTGCGCP
jgi:hypothetical protein